MLSANQFTIPEELDNQRLDLAVVKLMPQYSRSQISSWIKQGKVLLNSEIKRPKDKVNQGQTLQIKIEKEPVLQDTPQAIDFKIVYQDEHLIIVDKPIDLTVHPGSGQADGTLLNGLLFINEKLSQLPRAGIVHRIDKDTSGLLIVAQQLESYNKLVKMMQKREIKREYKAFVNNLPISHFEVDRPIGRNPKNRFKMAVLAIGGKAAKTEFSIIKKYRKHTLLKANLYSGRTHQIRVHCHFSGFPIIGDKTYTKRPVIAKGMRESTIHYLQQFSRQALHAYRLSFKHPMTQKELLFESPLPEDMQKLQQHLEEDLNEQSKAHF